jgi:transposase
LPIFSNERQFMIGNIVTYVGVDWAFETHYACILDPGGAKLAEKSFLHGGEGLQELADWIRDTSKVDPGQVAVGIEVPHGPVVESLMDSGFRVYAVNPIRLDRLRDRYMTGRAKDDKLDAMVIADTLRTDSRFYRFLEPVSPTIIELREWSRITSELSVERNRLVNRFRQQIWRYYPQMLDLDDDLGTLWVLAIWEHVPTPARACAVRRPSVSKILTKAKVRRWTADSVLECLRRPAIAVAPGVVESALAHCKVLAEQIRLVTRQYREAQQNLERLFKVITQTTADTSGLNPTDPDILRSMPGVGPLVLSTLLSEGYDAITRRDAKALRGLSGVTPVTRRSGKQYQVVMRTAAPRRLRIALYHWARVAVMTDFHTRNRYATLRKRGHSHARALRSVGSRLIGVACAMLQTGELFDPNRGPQRAMTG